ncbi:HP0495 family protein [Conchiformibius kuhniae]|uniref:UPF0250 protein LVJ77_09520 n=1 Tax=Conchiformibius kuhniae TaxID=211502 RepID=A0A8T9MVL3_9NEIS|nr:DUF493 domain-containing protein [Conchiformibius kuhniae]UOP04506.1 DUF493 domain-containing protein [Conchiformibius kuhniae]
MSAANPPLIEFPCDFNIKAMGQTHPDFAAEMLQAVQPHAPDTRAEHIVLRPSAGGNYQSATITVHVANQNQLDDIYRALTSHPLVKVVF